MTFDHRLAAPVRMTALGIRRNFDDGSFIRVRPILQQTCHLHGRPARYNPVPAARSRALQYA